MNTYCCGEEISKLSNLRGINVSSGLKESMGREKREEREKKKWEKENREKERKRKETKGTEKKEKE